MAEPRRVPGSNHIQDSIDADESDINPYSITTSKYSNPTTSSHLSDRANSNSTEAVWNDPPIYATVNKATKRPQPTTTQTPSATAKVPPKTQSKPQSRNSSSPSSPKLGGGTASKRTITNEDRHIYDLPSDVRTGEVTSGETTYRSNGNTNHDDDVIENPYDVIPGQTSPGIVEDGSVKLRNPTGGKDIEASSKKGWPKLPPLRSSEYATNDYSTSINELPPTTSCHDTMPAIKLVSVLYIGSMKITEEQLQTEKNTDAVRRCIAHFSQPSASPQFTAIQEWTADLSMQLCIYDDFLALRQSGGTASLVKDDLPKIKVWGTGKEQDSAIFAYVTRDDPSSSWFVCRVLKCLDCTGRQVINMIVEVCQNKLKRDEAAATGDTLKKGRNDAVLQRSLSYETKVTVHCHQVGNFTFTENSSKDELKKQIEEIRHSSPRESWTKVSLEISSSVILVRDSKTHNLTHATYNVKDIAGLGTHKDDNKFGCITTRVNGSLEYTGHVFHCEPSTDHWLLNIQTVCKHQLHESKSGIMKKMYKYFTGGKKS